MVASAVSLGEAVPIIVKLAPLARRETDLVSEGLKELYREQAFADVSLVCAGKGFLAHRAVLAAQSGVMRQGLASAPGGQMLQVTVSDVDNPEAVKVMLDWMYELGSGGAEDGSLTQAVCKDVLRLANSFQLPGLAGRAAYWLAQGITTANAVERLTMCEEFGLEDLQEKILAQLVLNKSALSAVAGSPQIMKFPRLMQALLQQAARKTEDLAPAKKARKA